MALEPDHTPEHHGTPLVTTVQETAWKARIEPYTESPTAELEAGVIGCLYCGNTTFRRSRVRFHDIGELLMLRYPMRCMRCNQRQHGYFLTAAFAVQPRSQSGRVARGNETWKAWTESEMNGQSLQRPMTTSIGTRATKLQPPPSKRSNAQRGQDHQDRRDDDRQIW